MKKSNWTFCPECKGQGRKTRKLRKKVRLSYLAEIEQFEKSNAEGPPPTRPKSPLYVCPDCKGSGLISSTNPPEVNKENYPHVAIVGGGIGGVALAVACLHRGIPFTLYERDSGFDVRSQGYGLTLQQARKAIEGLGLFDLNEGVISTRHVVHTTDGKIIGEWGMRKWMNSNSKTNSKLDSKNYSKRTNMHIARQSLRLALLEQLGGKDVVQWNHQLIDIKEVEGNQVELSFQVKGQSKTTQADLVVGADGIRSTVRNLIMSEETPPLRYLDCIVILGICPLSQLQEIDTPLLDSATVFQTANGKERIYIMPFTADSVMWQLSFPLSEKEAKSLSEKGPITLKKEACRRTQWHSPIPQIISSTLVSDISGYPVYDRELLHPEVLSKRKQITLIGDAAHPMSPFKGQGANQALLDALTLARGISKGCRPMSNWREAGIRETVLNEFESEMLDRSAKKVKDSAKAAEFLHSDVVLYEGDEPRGRCLIRNENSIS